jgi:hypothetical protein
MTNVAIKHQATISSITAKVDGSVGYKINTPELNSEQKTAIFDLQNQNVEVLINPMGAKEVLEVKTDLNQKSQSKRIRAVLFLLWQRDPEGLTFEEYYNEKTEKYIDWLKGKLE